MQRASQLPGMRLVFTRYGPAKSQRRHGRGQLHCIQFMRSPVMVCHRVCLSLSCSSPHQDVAEHFKDLIKMQDKELRSLRAEAKCTLPVAADGHASSIKTGAAVERREQRAEEIDHGRRQDDPPVEGMGHASKSPPGAGYSQVGALTKQCKALQAQPQPHAAPWLAQSFRSRPGQANRKVRPASGKPRICGGAACSKPF